jgi:hypothetical protein
MGGPARETDTERDQGLALAESGAETRNLEVQTSTRPHSFNRQQPRDRYPTITRRLPSGGAFSMSCHYQEVSSSIADSGEIERYRT